MRWGVTWVRLVAGAVGGVAVALLAGAAWVAIAPDNGFSDLAAAAVTTILFVPLGVVLGVVAAAVARRGSVEV